MARLEIWFACFLFAASALTAAPPTIVLFLVDDLGHYNGRQVAEHAFACQVTAVLIVGFNGNTNASTPQIDDLAR